ncbi:Phosphoribosyl-ATP pyrophosphatase [Candidatus Kinetoplastibacterium sorsogonicusi]|uniref:Phosphoribosyl-ATP pyrophosphatase n=1 Tax=Candidatus Kinetoplastidibacterium kentomonadis TaxID=1576550 RepID=A0A3Q8ETW9_9PROT|nr:phosphoribosyl-ATP diphosphatase [Candidatus Kinetoplastibacterium sorsogonicusi]AWD32163.1 Phosphoribosyl-ATP pyrophosphatase [Candidatus Kinetoplastibacterium sorsogonicusi]
MNNKIINTNDVLSNLANILESRLSEIDNDSNTKGSYTSQLFMNGPDAFLKKIGEESTELVMAAKDNISSKIVSEMADLWFHCLVLLSYYKLRPEDILVELKRREGISGITEKNSRTKI